MAATNLHVVLIGDGLEAWPITHEVGQVDVDGCAKSGSQVRRARSDIANVFVVEELGLLLDSSGCAGESLEDSADVGTLLHGDDTELILFVDPDEESLRIVVEDTSALGPVAVETAGIEETIALSVIKGAKSVRLLI